MAAIHPDQLEPITIFCTIPAFQPQHPMKNGKIPKAVKVIGRGWMFNYRKRRGLAPGLALHVVNYNGGIAIARRRVHRQ